MKNNNFVISFLFIVFSTTVFAETSWYEPNGITAQYGSSKLMADYELTSGDGEVTVSIERVYDYNATDLFPLIPNFEETVYSTGFGLGFFGNLITDFQTQGHTISAGYPNTGEDYKETISHNKLLKKILTSDEVDTYCPELNSDLNGDQCRLYVESYMKTLMFSYTIGTLYGQNIIFP
jgi:hypothetical protein